MPILVASLAGGRFETFDALVDTGATYTVVPRERLAALGVSAEERWPFVLADGREVSYGIALGVDPVTQRLIPVPGLLKRAV